MTLLNLTEGDVFIITKSHGDDSLLNKKWIFIRANNFNSTPYDGVRGHINMRDYMSHKLKSGVYITADGIEVMGRTNNEFKKYFSGGLKPGDWIQITENCGGIVIVGYYCHIISVGTSNKDNWVEVSSEWYDNKGKYLEKGSGYYVHPDKYILLSAHPDFTKEPVGKEPSSIKELLAEAKRRYPSGTLVKCVNSIGEFIESEIYTGVIRSEEHIVTCGGVIGVHDIIGYLYANGKWAQVMDEKSSVEEKLAEVKRRYPKGTLVRCIDANGNSVDNASEYIGSIVSTEDIKTSYAGSEFIGVNYITGFLYARGKWAEILPSEQSVSQPSSEFKVGDKVVVKEGAPYSLTPPGWKGVVTEVLASGTVIARGMYDDNFYLNPNHLSLQASGPEIQSEEDYLYSPNKITPIKSLTARLYEEQDN